MKLSRSIKKSIIVPALLVAGLAAFASTSARASSLLFSESFSVPNGTALNGSTPAVGSSWVVTGGNPVIQNHSVDTSQDSEVNTFAFAGFSRALSANEVLRFSFETAMPASGNIFTEGWAGLSLYTGGRNGTEQFFLGLTGGNSQWGIGGAAISNSQTFASVNAAVTLSFDYSFNTGNWDFKVGSETLSGTTLSNLALDTVRIGSDVDNIEDIKITSISANVIPEPSALALLGLGTVGLLARRRRVG
jgi:hypothetical protein